MKQVRRKANIKAQTCGLKKSGADEPICTAGTEMQAQRTDLGTSWGKEKVGKTERAALKYTDT